LPISDGDRLRVSAARMPGVFACAERQPGKTGPRLVRGIGSLNMGAAEGNKNSNFLTVES
jgi:hypothetical protein